MEKRKIEKLGIETSLLGYGCMRFPTTPEGKIDEEEAEKLLDLAYAGGVNYFDTAYPYHEFQSEIFLGKVLKKYDRNSFYLATKLPLWGVKESADAEKIFMEQLEKLQVEYVDFYLLHALSRDRWKKVLDLGILEYLEKWKAEGKIRYLGFSFHDSYEVFEEILRFRDWDFCQIQLNYMDTEIQAGMKGYHLTEQMNVPLVIMEPVKGGRLANYAEDVISKFRALDPDASTASYALRWVGSLPNVKVVLSGMSTLEQVEDNLKTFGEFCPLSVKEQATVQDVVDLINSRVQNGCTGCEYCMPCPAGVDIPQNFRAWNTYHMYQNYHIVRNVWEKGLGEQKQAKNCIKCGKCETVCPQKLQIRADLERVQLELEKAREDLEREQAGM